MLFYLFLDFIFGFSVRSSLKKCKKYEKYKEYDFLTPILTQVKEKFGTLRFYYQGGDEYVHGLVSMAESMTEVTCEECGDPGQSRGDGWIHVYCNTCEAEHEMNKLRREGFEE